MGLSCCPVSKVAGGAQAVVRDTAGTPDPKLLKKYCIPYGVLFNNKSWGKKEEVGGHLESWYLSFQVTVMFDKALHS